MHLKWRSEACVGGRGRGGGVGGLFGPAHTRPCQSIDSCYLYLRPGYLI